MEYVVRRCACGALEPAPVDPGYPVEETAGQADTTLCSACLARVLGLPHPQEPKDD